MEIWTHTQRRIYIEGYESGNVETRYYEVRSSVTGDNDDEFEIHYMEDDKSVVVMYMSKDNALAVADFINSTFARIST